MSASQQTKEAITSLDTVLQAQRTKLRGLDASVDNLINQTDDVTNKQTTIKNSINTEMANVNTETKKLTDYFATITTQQQQQAGNINEAQQLHQKQLEKIRRDVEEREKAVNGQVQQMMKNLQKHMEEAEAITTKLQQQLANMKNTEIPAIKTYSVEARRQVYYLTEYVKHPLEITEKYPLTPFETKNSIETVEIRKNIVDGFLDSDDDNTGDAGEKRAKQDQMKKSNIMMIPPSTITTTATTTTNQDMALTAQVQQVHTEDLILKNYPYKIASERLVVLLGVLKNKTSYFFDLIKFASEAFKATSTIMNKGCQQAIALAIDHVIATFENQHEQQAAAVQLKECIMRFNEWSEQEHIEKMKQAAPVDIFQRHDGPIMKMLETVTSYWFAYFIAAKQLGNSMAVLNADIPAQAWKEMKEKFASPFLQKINMDPRLILGSMGGNVNDYFNISTLQHFKPNRLIENALVNNTSNNNNNNNNNNAKYAQRNGAGKNKEKRPIFNSVLITDHSGNNNNKRNNNNNNNNNNNYNNQNNTPSRNQNNNNYGNNNNNDNTLDPTPLKWNNPTTTPDAVVQEAKNKYKDRCWKCNLWSPICNQQGQIKNYSHKTDQCVVWNEDGTQKEDKQKNLLQRRTAKRG